MRNMRQAIAGLVVALFVLFSGSPAYADETSSLDQPTVLDDSGQSPALDPPPDGNETATGLNADGDDADVAYFDYKRLKVRGGGTVVWGYTFSEFTLGGGALDTLDKGDEFSSASWFGYGQASVRFLTINLGSKVSLQLGPRLTMEGALFESSQYRGNKLRTGGALEMAFLHNSRDPLWQITLRPGLSFDHEVGASRVSNYTLHFQDSLMGDLEGIIDWLGFFIKTGEYRIWKNQHIKTGFFPNVELQFRCHWQLHASRSETFPGPDNDNTSYEAQIIPDIYRGAWEQGIIQFGPLFGCRWSKANGYISEPRGRTIVTLQFGARAVVQLHKNVFLGLNAMLSDELQTHRLEGSVGGYVSFNFW